MSLGGIIGGVASIGGALIGSNASKKAAKAQAASADKAAQVQWDMYNQTRTDMTPWREAGGQAIGSLSDMLQPGYDHTTSPGYQFRMDEGTRAIEGSAASKGMLMSGGTLKDLTRFAQGTAADDFNQQFNRTASVAAGGQQVGMGLGQMGANAASNAGNAYMQAGNAKASGYAGQASAFGGALNNLAGFAMMGGFGGGGGPTVPGTNLPGIY